MGCAAVAVFLCAVFAAGAEGSRAYRAHYEQNVQDELGLLLHDVLSRPMPFADQEHSLEVIAERVREWRRGQGLNTPEEDSEDSQNGVEWLYTAVAPYSSCFVITCAVLLGTVLYLRGCVTADAPPDTAPQGEPQALSQSGASPLAIAGGARDTAAYASGEGEGEGGATDAGGREKTDDDTAATAVEVVSGGEGRRQELAAASSSPSDKELLQVLRDRFEELKLQPDPASKRESAKVCARILSL